MEVVAWVVIAFTVISAIIMFTAKVYPFIRKLQTLMDDWLGEPERPGVHRRPGLMERMEKIESLALSSAYHTQPNHGGSGHDALSTKLDLILEKIGENNGEYTDNRAQ